MSNSDSDGSTSSEGEERGELVWNEFDWERYLQEQDEAVVRYLQCYESCRGDPNRIDLVAEKMSWNLPGEDGDAGEAEAAAAEDEAGEDDVYTLHQNPIYIATKAIYLSLNRSWRQLAADPAKVPQGLAVEMLISLQRGEEQAVQAIYALDFGDYAMAVSLFKRALGALNGSFSLAQGEGLGRHRQAATWRDDAVLKLFDLREIWLRVMGECREELSRPVDDEN